MTNSKDVAAIWLQGLAARGITTRLVNGRIRHFPASAYKQLTDEEVITLRHHRAEIRDALKAGPPCAVETPTPSEGVAPTLALAPEPEPCKWCYRAPCIGESHPAFDTLHPEAQPKPYDLAQLCNSGITVKDPFTSGLSSSTDDPVDVMMKMLGKPSPWDD